MDWPLAATVPTGAFDNSADEAEESVMPGCAASVEVTGIAISKPAITATNLIPDHVAAFRVLPVMCIGLAVTLKRLFIVKFVFRT